MTHRTALLISLTSIGIVSLGLLSACGPGDGCEVTQTCKTGPAGAGGGTGTGGPGGGGPGGSGGNGGTGAGGSGGGSTCGNGSVDAGEVCFGEVDVYDTDPLVNPAPGSDVVLVDCEGDGDLDVVSHIDAYLNFLRNDGAGNLTELSTYDLPSDSTGLSAGNIDANAGDELLVTYNSAYTDIMGLDGCTGELLGVLYHNGPSGTVPHGTPVNVNNGGVEDYAILMNSTLAFGIDGQTSPTEIDSSCAIGTAVVAAPFRTGGFDDLVYADAGTGVIRWAKSNGSALQNSFNDQIEVDSSPIALAPGDLDGDGDPDVVVLDELAASVTILRNNSGPTNLQFSKLVPAVSVTGTNGVHAAGPTAIAVADVDNDGDLDVVTANTDDGPGQSSISLLLNDGDANFLLASGFPLEVPRRPTGVAAADLNSDGAVDIVTAHDFNDAGTRHIGVLLAQP